MIEILVYILQLKAEVPRCNLRFVFVCFEDLQETFFKTGVEFWKAGRRNMLDEDYVEK